MYSLYFQSIKVIAKVKVDDTCTQTYKHYSAKTICYLSVSPGNNNLVMLSLSLGCNLPEMTTIFI